jgi:hypothetical protein
VVDNVEREIKVDFRAVKTLATGQTIMLPAHEVPAWEELVAATLRQYQPENFMEKLLAENIVNHQWRLRWIEKVKGALPRESKEVLRQERYLRKQLVKDTKELNERLRANPRAKHRGLFLVPKRVSK